jgi:hypothetical protein
MIVRIFKTKALARFTKRERISDASLTQAIENAGWSMLTSAAASLNNESRD